MIRSQIFFKKMTFGATTVFHKDLDGHSKRYITKIIELHLKLVFVEGPC